MIDNLFNAWRLLTRIDLATQAGPQIKAFGAQAMQLRFL